MDFKKISLVQDKDLPYNLTVEKTILAEILLDKNNLGLIFYKVKKHFFYSKKHQVIFEISKSLYEDKLEVNLDTVVDKLQTMGFLGVLVSLEELVTLINSVTRANTIESYIVLLIDKHVRRQLIYGAEEIYKLAYQSFDSIEILFDEAENILLSITQNKPTNALLLTSEVLLETFIDLEKRSKENEYSGIKTGFFDLDEMTQGFQKSDLIIIAGRPSMGKTAFALNVARNVSELQNFPIIIFSLEMSRQQLIYRFLSKESQVVHSKLRTGSISQQEWYSISQAISLLVNLKIYLDDTPNLSLMSIRNKMSNLQVKYSGIGLVVLDYLQLLNDPTNKDTRVQELSRLTRGLKILAKEFNTPILVLSQLSRSVESRINKRPILSDLRESGCIGLGATIYISSKNKYSDIQRLTSAQDYTILLNSVCKVTKKHVSLNVNTLKRGYFTGIKFVYKIQLLNHNAVIITACHKILTWTGWRKVIDLVYQDLITIIDKKNFVKNLILKKESNIRKNPNLSSISIININTVGNVKCYDLWIPFVNNYIANEIVVHNSIEQDADLVLMLYRDSYYDDSSSYGEIDATEVIITKHRNGPIGTVNVLFEPKTLTFENFIF